MLRAPKLPTPRLPTPKLPAAGLLPGNLAARRHRRLVIARIGP